MHLLSKRVYPDAVTSLNLHFLGSFEAKTHLHSELDLYAALSLECYSVKEVETFHPASILFMYFYHSLNASHQKFHAYCLARS